MAWRENWSWIDVALAVGGMIWLAHWVGLLGAVSE